MLVNYSRFCVRKLCSRPGLQLFERHFSSTLKRKAKAYISFGSNIGDRVGHIETACRLMNSLPRTSLLQTSGLYETKPMYVEDQGYFLNGVCELDTDLEPLELLNQLQSIEVQLKRKKIIDKGPRSIDLDIILYDDLVFSHERLNIPHLAMLDREFVLRPLCDIIPTSSPPSSFAEGLQYTTYLYNLEVESLKHRDTTQVNKSPSDSEKRAAQNLGWDAATALTFLSNDIKIRPASSPFNINPTAMAILNLTPDSFSDGGVHSPTDRIHLHATISGMIDDEALIIDIGGESTRPGSSPITADEELRRILSAISIAVKLCGDKAAISVDTYRASVAEEALKAGATIINDISGGRLDPDMLSTIARHNASIVLMHSRGTPQTMFSDPSYVDYGSDLAGTVAQELGDCLDAALKAGIPRWRILLDPGFGFAKTPKQNRELLGQLWLLRSWPKLKGLPWVIGVSRKRFVRELPRLDQDLYQNNDGREFLAEKGTEIAVLAAIRQDAEVLRLHDVTLLKRLNSSSSVVHNIVNNILEEGINVKKR